MQTTTQTQPTTIVFTVKQAAEYLGLGVSTLNKWRCFGGGPVFIKLGRAVRYRKDDLDAFIECNMNTSTSSYVEV